MVCEEVADKLALVVDNSGSASRTLLAHLDECLSCQAELSRYRRLLRLLAELQNESERLPDGMLSSIVGQIARAAERRALRNLLANRRGQFVVGIVAAAVSVFVTLLVRRSWARRLALGAKTPGESASPGC